MSVPSSMSNNLLIVEDDEGLRRQYRWMFPNVELSLAGTREEAIAAVRRQLISVAVVGLNLIADLLVVLLVPRLRAPAR